jgi:alpha-L-fucosidase
MNKLLSSLLWMLFICIASEAQVPLPSAVQMQWQRAEYGVLISYDLHVSDGQRYNQAQNRITPPTNYQMFNPERLDTDQWIRSVRDAGGKFAILTVTHETGFALYQSDINPFSLKSVQWRDGKGDILADFIASCRKYGILPGVYIGIRWNAFLGVYDFKIEGTSEFAKRRQSWYNHYCERMTEEILSKYGPLFFIWFDGGAHGPELGGADILPIAQRLQPGAIFYHNSQRADIRWGGSESGTVPYPCWSTYPFPYSHSTNQSVVFANDFKLLKTGDPQGKYYMPAMSDAPLRGAKGRHEWFWEPQDEAAIQSVDHLMRMYMGSVGHNSTLILGVTPGPDGLFPQADADTLKAFRARLNQMFSRPVAQIAGQETTLEMEIPRDSSFNLIDLSESLADGQRIRAFVIEVRQRGKWRTLVQGTSVGYRFLHRLKEPLKGDRLRLRVTESMDTPRIERLAVWMSPV